MIVVVCSNGWAGLDIRVAPYWTRPEQDPQHDRTRPRQHGRRGELELNQNTMWLLLYLSILISLGEHAELLIGKLYRKIYEISY